MRLFILLVMFPFIAMSQTNGVDLDSNYIFQDTLKHSVVLLIEKGNKDSVYRGSGVLVYSPSHHRFFIITAKHVAKFITWRGEVVFHKYGNISEKRYLTEFIHMKNLLWLNHDFADLSILEIFPQAITDQQLLSKSSINIDRLITIRQEIPSDFKVHIAGYPFYDLKAGRFSPTFIATNTVLGFMDLKTSSGLQTCIVLQNPAIQGISGGPVFIGVRESMMFSGPDKTYLCGIVSSTFYDNTGGKLAVATPLFYLKDFDLNNWKLKTR